MSADLGPQVASDLELSKLHECIPIQTSWGKDTFQTKLTECNTNPKQIRKQQLPLLIFKKESKIRENIQKHIRSLESKIESIDECLRTKAARIQELITQILWKRESGGAFLNTSPILLNCFITSASICLIQFSTSLSEINLPINGSYKDFRVS